MYNELLRQMSELIHTPKREYYKLDNYLFYILDTPDERLQYRNDMFWVSCSSEEFYRMVTSKLVYHHTVSYYGEPKLSKPKELKGIKQSFSVDYIPKKCKCKVFVKYPDVWIQHKRNEAWIRIQNLLPLMKYKSHSELVQEILRQQEKINNFRQYELCSSAMERMFEKIISDLTIT